MKYFFRILDAVAKNGYRPWALAPAVPSASPQELVWYYERHTRWAAYVSYLVIGCLPLAAWAVLTINRPPGPALRDEPWIMLCMRVLGWSLAIACALMSLSSYKVQRAPLPGEVGWARGWHGAEQRSS